MYDLVRFDQIGRVKLGMEDDSVNLPLQKSSRGVGLANAT